MRERMTRRSMSAAINKSVTALEVIIANDDGKLKSEADVAATEEKAIVKESVPAGTLVLKDQGDQNDKSGDNWPVSEEDKIKVAKKLVNLASELIG